MRRRQNGTALQFDASGPLAAVGYVRVSTEEQATEGVSLAAQEERIRAYCVLAGLNLVALVREEGVSGSKLLGERPEGARLLQLIGAHRARHVVALKLDRLFRNAVDALSQTQRWDKTDVALHLVDMGGQAINTGSAVGRMFLTMMAGFAEFERNMIAERTAAALRHKKAHRNVYARIPLGFVQQGEDLVEHPAEQDTVRRIQDMHAMGRNLSQIADELNHWSVPTKRGGRWHASTVRYILRNDLYAEPEPEPARAA